jgi:PadR family transcriptional regulator
MTMTQNDHPKLTANQSEMLVLSVLADEASYGYAVTKAIAAKSDGAFRLGPGQLYPLLSKLEKAGLVSTSWEEIKANGSDPDAQGRRRKWYQITDKGCKRLEQRVESHRRVTALIESFLSPGKREVGA